MLGGMTRLHQLTGPNQKRVTWSAQGSAQFKMDDTPTKTQIAGKKYVSRVLGLCLTYTGTATTGAGIVASYSGREDLINALLNQIQIDGCAVGTLVSGANMKPNLMDITEFYALNGRLYEPNHTVRVQGPATVQDISKTFFIPFGFFGCKQPNAMALMTSLVRDGNIKIDFGTGQGVTNTTFAGTFTASLLLDWSSEITIAPGFQATRFKSTATAGASSDTVVLNSFGRNSTLTGVQPRAAVIALLEGTTALKGDGTGAYLASSITDLSALFAGIEQTNDIQPLLKQILDPVGNVRIHEDQARAINPELYPLYSSSDNMVVNESVGAIAALQRYVPIIPFRKSALISKMPIADGNPNFQITANNTNPDHYCFLFALYQWEEAQFNALVERIAKDDVGQFLYGTNNLTQVIKTAKEKASSPNFSKLSFLPRKLLPPNYVSIED